MLIWEKLLLHVDGSGDFQWADIIHDTRVEIPRLVSEYRKTENLLRIIGENAVSHHTSMPLKYFCDSLPDRVSRERALVNALLLNHIAYEQDFNGLFAEGLGLGLCTGFVPIHAYWRDDVSDDWYQGVDMGAAMQQAGILPGMIDCWVGNPFDHVFDRSATRGNFRWSSYARVVAADAVRNAFKDVVPEVMRLEGSTRIPSTANFQRIARSWEMSGLGVHGSPVIQTRQDRDELMTLLCAETAPGVDTNWPDGRLQIVAIPGTVDLYRGEGGTPNHCLTLADQPLPAGTFSFENFYSHARGNDIHGKPWIEDIDQIQVDLNIALSKRWEIVNKMAEAPIVAPGGALDEDMLEIGGYNLLEVEPSLAAWRPAVMQWPNGVIQALDNECEEKRRAMYTIGGYQAVSRGEAPGSRIAAKAIQQLLEADRSVHAPVNVRFKTSACNFALLCWRQFKAYGDVPWLLTITGDEYAHLADPYVDNTKISDAPPHFKLVNSFGTTPEARAGEAIELMQVRGADGLPFLRTDEARRAYPDQSIFDNGANPDPVRRRRARTVAQAFLDRAREIREVYEQNLQVAQAQGIPMQPLTEDASDVGVQALADKIFREMEIRHKRLRDDDLVAHLAAYTEIIQDETADVIAREALIRRQDLYYQWQAEMARQSAPAPDEGSGAGEGGGKPGAKEKKPAKEPAAA